MSFEKDNNFNSSDDSDLWDSKYIYAILLLQYSLLPAYEEYLEHFNRSDFDLSQSSDYSDSLDLNSSMNAAKDRLSDAILMLEPLVDKRFVIPFQLIKPVRAKFANHLMKPSLELIASITHSILCLWIKRSFFLKNNQIKSLGFKSKRKKFMRKLSIFITQSLANFKKQIIKTIKSKKRAKDDPLIVFSLQLKDDDLKHLSIEILTYANSIDFELLKNWEKKQTNTKLDSFLYLSNSFLKYVMTDIFDVITEYWKKNFDHESSKQEWQDGYTWWRTYLEESILTTMILFRLDKEEKMYRPLSFLTREALSWYVVDQDDKEFKNLLVKINKLLYSWSENVSKKIKKVGIFNNDIFFFKQMNKLIDHHLVTCFKSTEDVAFVMAWAKILNEYDKSDSLYQRPKSFFKEKKLPWRMLDKLEIDYQFPGMGLVEVDLNQVYKEEIKKKGIRKKGRSENLYADMVKFLQKASFKSDITWYSKIDEQGYSWYFYSPTQVNNNLTDDTANRPKDNFDM